jgi:hypothetical protein
MLSLSYLSHTCTMCNIFVVVILKFIFICDILTITVTSLSKQYRLSRLIRTALSLNYRRLLFSNNHEVCVVQCFGSGLDPASIRSVDPDPESKSWSGRRAKITHKNRKNSQISWFVAGCSLLRAEGFSCSLTVLYGSLAISKLQFLIKKCQIFFNL